jgi:alkyl hydroperoxide reductase subunit AhpF
MALLSPSDQDKLRESFAEMTAPVRLLFFTQALDCEGCLQTRQILDELPALSDKITIDEVNFVLEKDRAATYGIDRVPAIVLLGRDDADSRIRFVGTPSGYEFISLVHAVLLVGGRASNLTDENRERIAAVDRPVTMQVFTTPT